MSLRSLALALAVGSMTLVGCDTGESTDTSPATPTTPAPTPQSDDEGGLNSTLKSAQDQAKGVAGDAQQQIGDAGAAAREQAGAASAAVTEKAQSLYDEAVKYIQENKHDLAEKSIAQLESMKAQLPADWQSKITSLRDMLNKAKAG